MTEENNTPNRNRNRGRGGAGRGPRPQGGQPRSEGSADRSAGGGGRPQRHFGRHERRPSSGGPRSEAFALFRLATGMNFFMHGAVRVFGDYAGFVNYTTTNFSDSGIPPEMLQAAGYAIPMVELIFGGLLILGLLSRASLAALSLLMTSLLFGVCLKQQWDAAGTQMVYVLALFFLYFQLEWNKYSLDRLIFKRGGR